MSSLEQARVSNAIRACRRATHCVGDGEWRGDAGRVWMEFLARCRSARSLCRPVCFLSVCSPRGAPRLSIDCDQIGANADRTEKHRRRPRQQAAQGELYAEYGVTGRRSKSLLFGINPAMLVPHSRERQGAVRETGERKGLSAAFSIFSLR